MTYLASSTLNMIKNVEDIQALFLGINNSRLRSALIRLFSSELNALLKEAKHINAIMPLLDAYNCQELADILVPSTMSGEDCLLSPVSVQPNRFFTQSRNSQYVKNILVFGKIIADKIESYVKDIDSLLTDIDWLWLTDDFCNTVIVPILRDPRVLQQDGLLKTIQNAILKTVEKDIVGADDLLERQTGHDFSYDDM